MENKIETSLTIFDPGINEGHNCLWEIHILCDNYALECQLTGFAQSTSYQFFYIMNKLLLLLCSWFWRTVVIRTLNCHSGKKIANRTRKTSNAKETMLNFVSLIWCCWKLNKIVHFRGKSQCHSANDSTDRWLIVR